jgi:hypothetical protein
MMRRPLLFSILGVALAATAVLNVGSIAAKAEPQDFERFTVDVAVLHPTFAIVPGAIFGETGNSTADAGGNPGRGTPFIVDGKIFRGGTLQQGAGMGDPNMPGSLGSWICKGIFTSQLGAEDVGFDTTQMFEFNGDRDAIWTEGLEAGLGKVGVITHRIILGGSGRFRGAQGEVVQESLGTNIGGTPNIRVTFKIQRDR